MTKLELIKEAINDWKSERLSDWNTCYIIANILHKTTKEEKERAKKWGKAELKKLMEEGKMEKTSGKQWPKGKHIW